MIDEELQRIWQKAPQEEQIRFEHSRLLLELKQKLSGLDKQVKRRNIREGFIIFLVFVTFGYYFYVTPLVWIKIGSLYFIGYGFYVAFMLFKTRRRKPFSHVYQTLNDYLHNYRLYLEQEKALLDNIHTWYILPLTPGIILFLSSGTYDLQNALLLLGGFLIIGITIFYLNKRAAEREIRPVLESIEDALASLEKEGEKT